MNQSKVLDKVKKDIENHGWHVLSVFGGGSPNFSYTIGFTETLNHPEIVMSGLSTELMHNLLNDIGELIKKGAVFKSGNFSDKVLNGYSVKFSSVNTSNINEYFRAAEVHYGQGNFETLQCIWPDKEGKFPCESDSSQEILV